VIGQKSSVENCRSVLNALRKCVDWYIGESAVPYHIQDARELITQVDKTDV